MAPKNGQERWRCDTIFAHAKSPKQEALPKSPDKCFHTLSAATTKKAQARAFVMLLTSSILAIGYFIDFDFPFCSILLSGASNSSAFQNKPLHTMLFLVIELTVPTFLFYV